MRQQPGPRVQPEEQPDLRNMLIPLQMPQLKFNHMTEAPLHFHIYAQGAAQEADRR